MTVAIVIADTLSGAGSNLACRTGSRVSPRDIRLIILRQFQPNQK